MIYNENGNFEYGNFNKTSFYNGILDDINSISESFNNIMSLLEKETIMKSVKGGDSALNPLISYKDINRNVSIQNNDIFTSRDKKNGIDEKKVELLLRSENICKEYEMLASFDIDNLIIHYLKDEEELGKIS